MRFEHVHKPMGRLIGGKATAYAGAKGKGTATGKGFAFGNRIYCKSKYTSRRALNGSPPTIDDSSINTPHACVCVFATVVWQNPVLATRSWHARERDRDLIRPHRPLPPAGCVVAADWHFICNLSKHFLRPKISNTGALTRLLQIGFFIFVETTVTTTRAECKLRRTCGE